MNSFEKEPKEPMVPPGESETSQNLEQEQSRIPDKETLEKTQQEFFDAYSEFLEEKSKGKTAGYGNLDDTAEELKKFKEDFEVIFDSKENGGGIEQNQKRIEAMTGEGITNLRSNIEKTEEMVNMLKDEDVIASFEEQIKKARKALQALESMLNVKSE